MNMDRADKKRHTLVELSQYSSKKEFFLFNSFGFNRLKEFITQDDENIINKIMYDLKKLNRMTM